MSGAIRAVDHVGISVSDLDRAIRFFRDGLGGETTEPQPIDDPRVAAIVGLPGLRNTVCQVAVGGSRFELLQYAEPRGRQAENHRPCDPGHMHLALAVEDIDAVVAHLREHGFAPAGLVQRGIGRQGLAACYCYGFDGLVVELIEYQRPA